MPITLRLPENLHLAAAEYARELGISLNALVAVSLKDYLDARAGSAPAGQAPLTVSETAPPAPVKPLVQAPSRNAPCPCGSGKKYKHCCGRNTQNGSSA